MGSALQLESDGRRRALSVSLGLLTIVALAGCTHKSADSYIQSGDQARLFTTK